MKRYILLAKSTPNYKYTSGYFLSGYPLRWHKITPKKQPPKGAPISSDPFAHPASENSHKIDHTLIDDHLLDAANVNAGGHNKKISQIKELSETGNITGILGSSFGTNTYGVKQAKLANQLLKMHGVSHQVSPGQKAGEHPAVKTNPTAAALEAKDAALDAAIDHLEGDKKQGNIPAAEKKEDAEMIGKLKAAKGFAADTSHLQAAAEKHEKKKAEFNVTDVTPAGYGPDDTGDSYDAANFAIDNLPAVDLGGNPAGHGEYVANVFEKVPESVADALNSAVLDLKAGNGGQHKGKNESVSVADLKSIQGLLKRAGVKHFINDDNDGELPVVVKKDGEYVIHDGNHRLAAIKLLGNETALVHVIDLDAEKPASVSGGLSLPEFAPNKNGETKFADFYKELSQKVISLAGAGDLAGLKGMAGTGKVWEGKTPNSKKFMKLYADAMAVVGDKKPVASGLPESDFLVEMKTSGGSAKDPLASDQLDYLLSGKLPAGGLPEFVDPKSLKSAPNGTVWMIYPPKSAAHYKPGDKHFSDGMTPWKKLTKTSKGFHLETKNSKGFYKEPFSTSQLGDLLGGGYGNLALVSQPGSMSDTGPAVGSGPKDGDTKEGADGDLVFKNGRWHKVDVQAEIVDDDLSSAVTGNWEIEPDESGPFLQAETKFGAVYLVSNSDESYTGVVFDAKGDIIDEITSSTASKAAAWLGKEFHAQPPVEQIIKLLRAESKSKKTAIDNLSLINFEKQMLPSSNSNAKANNAKVAKIKELAAAGDVAGLQAMTFGSNNYAKNQKKLALAAIAALSGGFADTGSVSKAPGKNTNWIFDPEDAGLSGLPAISVAMDDGSMEYNGSVAYIGFDDSDGTYQAGLIPVSGDEPDTQDFTSLVSAVAWIEKNTDAGKIPGKVLDDFAAATGGGPAPSDELPDYTGRLAGKLFFSKESTGDINYSLAQMILPGGDTVNVASMDGDIYRVALVPSGVAYKFGDDSESIFESPLAAANYANAMIAKYADKPGFDPKYFSSMMVVAIGTGSNPNDYSGPKNGDTKQGVDGILVFKDGYWHKVEEPAPDVISTTHTLLHTTDGHNKVYKVTISGNKITTQYGKIGGTLKSDTKVFASEKEAGMAFYKLETSKIKKGYKFHQATTGVASDQPAPIPVPLKEKPKAEEKPAAPKPSSGPESISGWKKTGGQLGYNSGGTYRDADGVEWYCKFSGGGEDVARSEILAMKLYEAAGLAVPEMKLVSQDGKIGTASKIIAGLTEQKNALASGNAHAIFDGFAADAWLANWDVVGNNPEAGKGFDNIQFVGDTAYRVDAGGALNYKGTGAKKSKHEWKDSVEELDTLLQSSANPNTSKAFAKITPADIKASVARVAGISDLEIRALVNKFGAGDSADKLAMAERLIARKNSMIAQHPVIKKKKQKKKPVFDASKLQATIPDFLNWNGPGKAGPATSLFRNTANQNGVNALFELAKSGSIDAIKAFELPVIDADTGNTSGMIKALDHPSQHIRSFAQQLINEIDYQLNPPEEFRWSGDGALMAVHEAFPPVTAAAASNMKNLGYYVRLGKTTEFPHNEIAGLPHQTFKNGKITRDTFAKTAKEHISKIPKLQQDAVRSYTGGSYGAINKSLWAGNPSGAAASASAALKVNSHPLPAGMVVGRRIDLYGDDLIQMVGKDLIDGPVGKVGTGATGEILQEIAVCSTSINHAFWGGHNVHLKMTIGPGVKGLWVGAGSNPNNSGSFSVSDGPSHREDEILLPPDTRMVVKRVLKSGGIADADGFGANGSTYIVEVLVLPN